MATPNLLCYLEESFVYFVNNSTPLDFGLGAYPPNNVQVSLENETEIVFRKSQQAGGLDIITARQFDEILDKTGAPYGATAEDAFNAIVAAIKVSSGGGVGGATAANQQLQIDEAVFQTDIQNATLTALPSIRTSGLSTVAATEQMAANQINGAQVSKDFLLAVDIGLMPNFSTVKKSGKNFDVDTATTPESIWNGGGLYTGFPTSGFGTLQAFSSSAADIGTLTITYLETSASTAYITANIAINGTTPTNTAITAYRVHTAFFTSSANTSTQLNAGVITVRYTATPAVVFLAMPAGGNQSYMAGYTIPAGKKGLLFPTTWRANLVAGASVECAMYLRNFNSGVRMRRNVSITSGTPATDAYEGGILLDELTDIMPTVLTSSANNVTVEASYTIMIFNA